MNLHCQICGKDFKDQDEVRFTADAFWKHLASKVNYAVSQPHNVNRDSFRHIECEEDLLEENKTDLY